RSGIGRAFAAMDFRFRRSARCFRTGTRAYPSAVCEERTTKSELKRQAAPWVAPQLASGFVAPQSQPHFGGCSFVAPRQKPTAAQQMPTQFVNGTLAAGRTFEQTFGITQEEDFGESVGQTGRHAAKTFSLWRWWPF